MAITIVGMKCWENPWINYSQRLTIGFNHHYGMIMIITKPVGYCRIYGQKHTKVVGLIALNTCENTERV